MPDSLASDKMKFVTSRGPHNPAARFRRCLLLASLFLTTPSCADILTDIGYAALLSRPSGTLLGNSGAGIPVAQVEAPPVNTSNYAPDFNNSSLAGKSLTLRSGASGISVHATSVALNFYGSAAVGRGVSTVSLYSTDGFLLNVLRTKQTGLAPLSVPATVLNNSWVASYTTDESATSMPSADLTI